MNRRQLLQSSAIAITATALSSARTVAQSSGATPAAPPARAGQPVDTRSRELVERMAGLSPLAVLESLESASIENNALLDAGAGAPVIPRPWNDPLDTDLEHALGGVLIVASDDPINSPDLAMLGSYIVFESPEIAFDVFARQLDEMGNQPSMTVAGTKAWMAESGDLSLAIMRLGYVLIVAGAPPMTPPGVPEGMVDHLIAVTEEMA